MDDNAPARWAVTLEAPLGMRRGTLTLDGLQGKCSGTLELMGARNAVSGDIRGGRCRLTGAVHTPLLDKPFEAEGAISRDEVELTLRFASGGFRLHGTREDE